jgi:hypothetical protein
LKWFEDNLNKLHAEWYMRWGFGEPWWSEDESVWERDKKGYEENINGELYYEATLTEVFKSPNFHIVVEGKKMFEMKMFMNLLENKLASAGLRVPSPNVVGKYLRRIGYESGRHRVDGRQLTLWCDAAD